MSRASSTPDAVHGALPRSPGVVQRQLDAYNAKDLAAWLRTHHPDAQHHALRGELLAAGRRALAERMSVRFAETDLQAELLGRTVVEDIVVDHERVTRNFAAGKGVVDMLAIYHVKDSQISKATFALRDERLLPAATT